MRAGRGDRLSPGRETEVGKEALVAHPAHSLYSSERRVQSFYEPRYHPLDVGVFQIHLTSLERVPQWMRVRMGQGCQWSCLTRYSHGVFPGLRGAAALEPSWPSPQQPAARSETVTGSALAVVWRHLPERSTGQAGPTPPAGQPRCAPSAEKSAATGPAVLKGLSALSVIRKPGRLAAFLSLWG